MQKPSVILNTFDGKHKLTFGESTFVGTDNLDSEVIIPIICDNCEFRIFHKDKLVTTETHERQMGSEMYHVNDVNDFECPRCKSTIHIMVKITEYAHSFMFHDYENENCEFSHAYDLEKLYD